MPKNYCVLKLAAFLLEVDDEKCIVSNISGYIFQIVTYLFMKREVQWAKYRFLIRCANFYA